MNARGSRWTAIVTIVVALAALGGCQPAPPPDYAAELGPAVETYIRAWNTGDFEALDGAFAPGFKRRTPRGVNDADGLEELKGVIQSFRTTYPDLRLKVPQSYFGKDVAYLKWTATGTNTGEGAIPPTGKAISISGLTLARFAGGKIVEEDVFYDTLDFMQQLGYTLMPPPAPAAE